MILFFKIVSGKSFQRSNDGPNTDNCCDSSTAARGFPASRIGGPILVKYTFDTAWLHTRYCARCVDNRKKINQLS
jgi:hypothetical protein